VGSKRPREEEVDEAAAAAKRAIKGFLTAFAACAGKSDDELIAEAKCLRDDLMTQAASNAKLAAALQAV